VETTEAEVGLQAFVFGKTGCLMSVANKIQNLKLSRIKSKLSR